MCPKSLFKESSLIYRNFLNFRDRNSSFKPSHQIKRDCITFNEEFETFVLDTINSCNFNIQFNISFFDDVTDQSKYKVKSTIFMGSDVKGMSVFGIGIEGFKIRYAIATGQGRDFENLSTPLHFIPLEKSSVLICYSEDEISLRVNGIKMSMCGIRINPLPVIHQLFVGKGNFPNMRLVNPMGFKITNVLISII